MAAAARSKSAEAHALRPCLGQRQVIAGVAQPYEFITYREAAERVAALASGFAGLGLKAGDRVGIFGPNCLEWMLAMQARAPAAEGSGVRVLLGLGREGLVEGGA